MSRPRTAADRRPGAMLTVTTKAEGRMLDAANRLGSALNDVDPAKRGAIVGALLEAIINALASDLHAPWIPDCDWPLFTDDHAFNRAIICAVRFRSLLNDVAPELRPPLLKAFLDDLRAPWIAPVRWRIGGAS